MILGRLGWWRVGLIFGWLGWCRITCRRPCLRSGRTSILSNRCSWPVYRRRRVAAAGLRQIVENGRTGKCRVSGGLIIRAKIANRDGWDDAAGQTPVLWSLIRRQLAADQYRIGCGQDHIFDLPQA